MTERDKLIDFLKWYDSSETIIKSCKEEWSYEQSVDQYLTKEPKKEGCAHDNCKQLYMGGLKCEDCGEIVL